MTSRFTMALHALGMIALEGGRDGGAPITSAHLAGSINTNPVVVRRVLADLRRAGLVETRRGVGGGVVLARPPGEITLRAVFEALGGGERLFARHPSGPNPACPMGCCVAAALEALYGRAEAAVKASLGTVTLAELGSDVAGRLPAARRAQRAGPTPPPARPGRRSRAAGPPSKDAAAVR